MLFTWGYNKFRVFQHNTFSPSDSTGTIPIPVDDPEQKHTNNEQNMQTETADFDIEIHQ